jgi:hypothetical protein
VDSVVGSVGFKRGNSDKNSSFLLDERLLERLNAVMGSVGV